MTFVEWVIVEALYIKSDKCTFARDWNVWCCYRHDLSCHYGRDPYSAYKFWCLGEKEYWLKAKGERRRDADIEFWKCNRKRSRDWKDKVRSNVRYLGVRVGALLPPY